MVEILGLAVAFVNIIAEVARMLGLSEDVITSLADIAAGIQEKIDGAEAE